MILLEPDRYTQETRHMELEGMCYPAIYLNLNLSTAILGVGAVEPPSPLLTNILTSCRTLT